MSKTHAKKSRHETVRFHIPKLVSQQNPTNASSTCPYFFVHFLSPGCSLLLPINQLPEEATRADFTRALRPWGNSWNGTAKKERQVFEMISCEKKTFVLSPSATRAPPVLMKARAV